MDNDTISTVIVFQLLLEIVIIVCVSYST